MFSCSDSTAWASQALRHKALRSIKWIAALGDHEHLGNLTAALDLARTQSRILFDEQYYSLNLQHPSGVSMDLGKPSDPITGSVPHDAERVGR